MKIVLIGSALATSLIPPSQKVFGLGWALFSCIILAVILVILCILLSQQEYAGLFYIISGLILALYVMILALIPKLKVGDPISLPSAEIDWTHYPRIVFLSFTTIFSAVGIAGVGIFHWAAPVYAKQPN
ncbi:hypothetical protein HDV06_005788 [Boothiomyces sp. JEL0866]|nr:hypothetical protein HDV06_005788 [Boothiomyces sp. JEL0866]